jgi:hypothetical protein
MCAADVRIAAWVGSGEFLTWQVTKLVVSNGSTPTVVLNMPPSLIGTHDLNGNGWIELWKCTDVVRSMEFVLIGESGRHVTLAGGTGKDWLDWNQTAGDMAVTSLAPNIVAP